MEGGRKNEEGRRTKGKGGGRRKGKRVRRKEEGKRNADTS